MVFILIRWPIMLTFMSYLKTLIYFSTELPAVSENHFSKKSQKEPKFEFGFFDNRRPL